MTPSDRAWLMAALGIGAAEIVAASRRKDATLSRTTRRLFHTETTVGRATFGVAWIGFSGWVLRHILGGKDQ